MTIPVAFEVAATDPDDIGAVTRRAVRDHMKDGQFLRTCVRDIVTLLRDPADGQLGDATDLQLPDVVMLWNEDGPDVPAGVSYGQDDEYDDGVDQDGEAS